MSVLKKVFLITICVMCFSISFCYAIDENQLTTSIDSAMSINTEENTSTAEKSSNIEENTSTTGNSSNIKNSVKSAKSENSLASSSLDTTSATIENQGTTTVSNVSSVSSKSTITNILNIALLVVGVLLIFLAIAILIRLNS